ncbi:hypothetical protein [Kitasatospora fiedleri]|uniref:hypothetical protein n=1 Tax=Kitasatospora fiedleri TaxID=2991545 RepID=UPI00249A6F8E|nr:hypothetical protein [Kitasatospora fiedleri]
MDGSTMRDANDTPTPGSKDVLARLETYYDAVPRFSATTEEHGPFTLFVRTGQGWHYYGRPTPGGPGVFTAEDVERVRARQREIGAPESFEWVHETTPGLRAAVEATGLEVHEHPLLVLDLDESPPAEATTADAAAGAAADDGPRSGCSPRTTHRCPPPSCCRTWPSPSPAPRSAPPGRSSSPRRCGAPTPRPRPPAWPIG